MQRRSFLCSVGLSFLAIQSAARADEVVREVQGIDLGTRQMTVFVARDKETWGQVKKEVGAARMLPIGMPQGQELDRLDGVDFAKEMIVAVFWGQISFSGQGEKCTIKTIEANQDEVKVHCHAKLWGGAADASYRAWPYHAKVVPASKLPVRFTQTSDFPGNPARSEVDKLLVTLKPGEWKSSVSPGK